MPVLLSVVFGLALLVAVSGCQTNDPPPGTYAELPGKSSAPQPANPPAPVHSESLILREGDTLKLTFLGAPKLDTAVAIRRDGKINLYLVGEVTAAGLTPAELEKELKKRYKDQIVVNEVTVSVESDTFPIYVTGAVMRPQKITPNRPLTIVEAVMEAGGPDYSKANLKAVIVLRPDAGRVKSIKLNLRDMLGGKGEPFYMKPGDTIVVHEKFAWL